jgi:hypothetical protein
MLNTAGNRSGPTMPLMSAMMPRVSPNMMTVASTSPSTSRHSSQRWNVGRVRTAWGA